MYSCSPDRSVSLRGLTAYTPWSAGQTTAEVNYDARSPNAGRARKEVAHEENAEAQACSKYPLDKGVYSCILQQ